jgi:GT2 family glycosyltransferase
MDHSTVTIVVVPRERFSFAARSLDSVLEHTPASVKLVYVDGGSPPTVRRFVERRASDRSFTLIRKNYFLSPNRARNPGLRDVTTKYVVFLDNDVLVSPHWLDALVECAEQTGAWVVGPTYCEEEPAGEIIHMAGGRRGFRSRRAAAGSLSHIGMAVGG